MLPKSLPVSGWNGRWTGLIEAVKLVRCCNAEENRSYLTAEGTNSFDPDRASLITRVPFFVTVIPCGSNHNQW